MNYMNYVAKRTTERQQQQEVKTMEENQVKRISVEEAALAKDVSLSQIRTALRNGQQQEKKDPWLNGVKEAGAWFVLVDDQWEKFGRKRAKPGSKQQEPVLQER